MTDYRSPILQYSNVDVAEITARGTDLLITEGDPLRAGNPNAAVSDGDVATLIAGGTEVVGYVNVAVTDSNRPYWDAAWTDDGTDTGTPASSAPAWLQNSTPLDFDPASPGPEARVVDYTDAAWQQIVIDQALDLQSRGYSGIFLDDLGVYYGDGSAAVARASAMVDLILAIRDAVGAAFRIVTNGVPFLGTDASRNAEFTGAIDAMVLESYVLESTGNRDLFVNHALTYVAPGAQLVGVDYPGIEAFSSNIVTRDDLFDYHRYLDERGIVNFFSDADITPGGTLTYDNAGIPEGAPASGDDVLFGHGGKNVLRAGSGNDKIAGFAGNDRLNGQAGDDILLGGLGNDRLSGGGGRDELTGGGQQDVFQYARMAESRVRSTGRDMITDFTRTDGDRIDLHAIDADPNIANDQDFTFIGRAAFTGQAGELRYVRRADSLTAERYVIALADTDGDSKADFAIDVYGTGNLKVTDFDL